MKKNLTAKIAAMLLCASILVTNIPITTFADEIPAIVDQDTEMEDIDTSAANQT